MSCWALSERARCPRTMTDTWEFWLEITRREERLLCAFLYLRTVLILFTPWRTASTSRSTRGRCPCRPPPRRTTSGRGRSGRGGNGKCSRGKTGFSVMDDSSWPGRVVSSQWLLSLLLSHVAFSLHSSKYLVCPLSATSHFFVEYTRGTQLIIVATKSFSSPQLPIPCGAPHRLHTCDRWRAFCVCDHLSAENQLYRSRYLTKGHPRRSSGHRETNR